MTVILNAAQVEAAGVDGARELAIEPGTIVTPLARDRADAMGIDIVYGPVGRLGSNPGPGAAGAATPGAALRRRARSARNNGADLDRLVLESQVRILARRALLRAGRGLGRLEELVTAVMVRLYGEDSPNGATTRGGGGR